MFQGASDHAVELGRPFGVPLRVEMRGLVVLTATNWLAVALLCLWTRPDVGLGGAALVALAVSPLLVVSALLHEYAHLVAALGTGQPVGAVVMNLFGGCIVVDEDAPGLNDTHVSALVFAAGPAANALLWLSFGLASDALRADMPGPALAFAMTAALNGALLAINLLPVEPLDGGRLMRTALRAWLQWRPPAPTET